MKAKYRIMAVTPNLHDAMSYYRTVCPLLRLEEEYNDVEVVFGSPDADYSWDTFMRFNILFIQRPSTEKHLDLILKAKRHGLKVWVDIDDLLWGVTIDSPAFAHFNQQKTKELIKQCLFEPDLVTTSTQLLLDKTLEFTKREKPIHVVRNAVDFNAEPTFKNGDGILWRGSHTHQADLLEHKEALINFGKQSKAIYYFYGYAPWFIMNSVNCNHYGYFDDLTEYFRTVKTHAYSLAVAPLVDNDFNRCKSDIAALEAVMAGTTPLGPDWAEWSAYPRYTPENLLEKMTAIHESTEMVKYDGWLRMVNYIKECRTLKLANEFRYTLIQSL